MTVPSEYGTFKFNIQTLKPSFQVDEFGLKAQDKETMSLSGAVTTADVEESAKIEKLLSASLDNASLKISWQHNEANKTHDFIINNIKRKTVAANLVLSRAGFRAEADQADCGQPQFRNRGGAPVASQAAGKGAHANANVDRDGR